MFKQHINALKTEMEVLLTRFTGIKKDGFDKVLKDFDKLEEPHQELLHQFLVDFRQNEYAELYRIFRLPLDHHQPNEFGYALWSKYFEKGKTNLIEVQLFRSQARKCRDKWRSIPKLCIHKSLSETANGKKKKVENHQDANQPDSERVSA